MGSYDGLGLYWQPKRQENAKRHLLALTNFLKSPANGDEGWRLASTPDFADPFFSIRVAYHYVVRRNKSLLAHLKGRAEREVESHPYSGLFSAKPDGGRTYRFPTRYVWDLLYNGFTSGRDGEIDETAQLIAFLLFAGGSRLSELFHVWVNDLQWIDDLPLIFLHHPREGRVHHKGRNLNRVEFLESQTRIPRNKRQKRGHAGFKGLAGELDGAQLIWLPIDILQEELGKRLRHYLAVTRPRIMRLRRAKGLPDHNYLFVGSGKMFGNNTNAIGEPYTIEAFRSAWKAAIGRVSNLRDDPNLTVAKRKGTTPHGARHFYGTFLKTIGCDGEIIAECMHHKSPFSHLRYTQLMPSEINEILEGKEASPSSSDFMKRSVSEAVAAQSRRYSFH
ncbi:site-specific integrase [Rhizobium ruizarguesonis]|uniref:site-specific integrase n=1 Tax=Rhizobium ruizarguesonis TaxID=2081791 RepID=UPI0013EF35F8|nr:site-specific integrase [Rhizobium ruizarguesonis]